MSRKPRMHKTGDVHHVMAHGIDSLKLFYTDDHRRYFLSLMDKHFTENKCHCYGFALMDNHYHMILRPSGNNFSDMMRNINSAYASWLNKQLQRNGYVFRNRFKSIPTRDQNYIRNLIMYVHANPLRAGNVLSINELDSLPSHRISKKVDKVADCVTC